jgi:hypothetical protein
MERRFIAFESENKELFRVGRMEEKRFPAR